MAHAGQCACGTVKAVLSADPLWVSHCHCPSCRKATGAAFASYAGFASDTISWDGAPTYYGTSDGVKRGFCGTCGSVVSYQSTRYPGEVHFHLGFMDNPDAFTPEGHVYTCTQLCWIKLDDGLPRADKYGG